MSTVTGHANFSDWHANCITKSEQIASRGRRMNIATDTAIRVNPLFMRVDLLIEVSRRSLNGPSTQQLVDLVHSAAAQQIGIPIVLDMTRVKFAPSVALGALVRLARSFEFDGRRLAFVGVDTRVRDTMRITRLDRVLEIHPDLTAFLSQPQR